MALCMEAFTDNLPIVCNGFMYGSITDTLPIVCNGFMYGSSYRHFTSSV